MGLACGAEGQSNVGVFRPPAQNGRGTVRQPFPSADQPAINGPSYPVYPIAFTLLPAIVMSDGTVYANFGFGYEPVSRACGRSRVLDGRGMSTSQRYPQPAPAQRTASEQNLPSAQARRAAAARAAQGACYARDGYGRLVVVR